MNETQDSLTKKSKDPIVRYSNKIITYSVKILAVLMAVVIVWSLFDVVFHLYRNFLLSFESRFNSDTLVQVLGSFLAVLIAIEVFLNILFYLKKDAIHVPLVLATALTAISRKVILIDFTMITPPYIFGTAALILALGISYWLITKHEYTS